MARPLMICPKCRSNEIDPGSTCRVCGYHAAEEKSNSPLEFKSKRGQNTPSAGVIELDYAAPSERGAEQPQELPKWRQELAQRLQQIKQKRQKLADAGPAAANMTKQPAKTAGSFATQPETPSRQEDELPRFTRQLRPNPKRGRASAARPETVALFGDKSPVSSPSSREQKTHRVPPGAPPDGESSRMSRPPIRRKPDEWLSRT